MEARSDTHSGAERGPAAGVVGRLTALAVDALLLTTLLFVVSIALSATVGSPVRVEPVPGAGGHRLVPDSHRIMAAGLLNGLLGAVYFVGFWAVGAGREPRATPGQLLLGIRVGRASDVHRLTLGQAAARWALLMGPLIASALVAPVLPMLRAPLGLVSLAWYLVLLVSTVRSGTGRGLHDRLTGSTVIPRAGAGQPMAVPTP